MTSIKSHEYWARKGDVELYMYRKYDGSPEGKPVLMLVHGSSLSALPSYDIQVPGADPAYSFMDQCAHRGFDVWTIDHEGYGRSTRTGSNSDIAMAVGDLAAAAGVVEKETSRSRFHCYGQSSGALRAALFAQKQPHRVDRLVLDAFVWTGEGSPTLAKRREQLPHLRQHNVRKIDKEMIRSIFTRDKPGTSEPVIADAVADAQLSYGEMIPTGTYLDMCANLPVVDPAEINNPVLIMRGEHDGIATSRISWRFSRSCRTATRNCRFCPARPTSRTSASTGTASITSCSHSWKCREGAMSKTYRAQAARHLRKPSMRGLEVMDCQAT